MTKFIEEQRELFYRAVHEQDKDYQLQGPAAFAESHSESFSVLTSRLQRTVQTIENFDPKIYDIKVLFFAP